jgi:hypothetical protein
VADGDRPLVPRVPARPGMPVVLVRRVQVAPRVRVVLEVDPEELEVAEASPPDPAVHRVGATAAVLVAGPVVDQVVLAVVLAAAEVPVSGVVAPISAGLVAVVAISKSSSRPNSPRTHLRPPRCQIPR